MERIINIVLGEFNSLNEALEYMNESGNYFAFSVGDIQFSSIGDELTTQEKELLNNQLDVKVLHINTFINEIYSEPTQGQLYVEDGFLKYYTEN